MFYITFGALVGILSSSSMSSDTGVTLLLGSILLDIIFLEVEK